MLVGQVVYAALGASALAPILYLVWQYSSGAEPLSSAAIIAAVCALLVISQFQRRLKGPRTPRGILSGRLSLGTDDTAAATRARTYLIDAVVLGVGVAGIAALGAWIGDRTTFSTARFAGLSGASAWLVIAALIAVTVGAVLWVVETLVAEGSVIERRRVVAEAKAARAAAEAKWAAAEQEPAPGASEVRGEPQSGNPAPSDD